MTKTLTEILSKHIEGGIGAYGKLYDDLEKYIAEATKPDREKMAEDIKTPEQILREEVLKSTKGKEYDHNITEQGIINAMKRYALENIKSDRDKVANYLYKRGATFKDVDGKFATAGDLINENDIPIELS